MICYTTHDGYVIERVFRGNCASAKTCEARLQKVRPEAIIRCAPDMIKSKTLYDACCELTPLAEDAETGNWFVSVNKLSARALATLSIISKEHNWRVLQSEEMFTEWAKDKVR